jgi:hypothetical protein
MHDCVAVGLALAIIIRWCEKALNITANALQDAYAFVTMAHQQ